jgi:hypothetical protein
MSILKHPVFLALLMAAITFSITYYYFNYHSKPSKSKNAKNKNKKKREKNTKDIIINETMVLSSAIAGLIAWYITSHCLTNEQNKLGESDNNGRLESGIMNNPVKNPVNNPVKNTQKGGSSHVSHLESDDPTRSYNLIGTGVNIPKGELKIPSVLIDYK